jgi:hypothetical protein
MWAFLLKNPPASVLGVFLAFALIACGIQSLRLANSQSDLAGEKLAFSDFKAKLAEESSRVQKAAADKSAKQAADLKDAIADARAIGAQTITEVHYVQSNGGPCIADPKWRATVGGVQRILDGNSGSDQGKAGGGAPRVVPGAAAAGPK